MITDALTNPTVKAAIEALQRSDRGGWSALFEPDAKLCDDGSPRSLEKFTRDALGHERFTSIERVDNDGLDVVGAFTRTNEVISERTSTFSSPPRAK